MGRQNNTCVVSSSAGDEVHALLAQSPDAVVTFDRLGRILFANERAEALWRRSVPQMVGQDIVVLLPRKVLRGDAWDRSESETITLDLGDAGRRHCVLSRAKVIPETAEVFVATLRDITAETRDRERLSLLSLALDESGTSVVVADARGRILYTNPGFELLTGHASEWALGRTPGSFLQGELSDPDTIRRIGGSLRRGLVVHEEIVNYTRRGVPYLIELAIFPVRDGSGQVCNFVSVQANVTAMREAQRRQAAMLDAISGATGIAQWSATGAALECNALLAAQGPDRPALSAILTEEEQAALVAGGIVRRELAWPCAGSEPLWLTAVFSCTRNITGGVDRFIMCGADATARRASIRAGSEAMQAMMERIDGLTNTVRRVSKMTNILSVNAAIEAVRAGETGRGFGVIATEIRALSGEVHDTLGRIDTLIQEGRDTVGRLQGTSTLDRR